jgi:dTDP-4-dehydrorhamnose 3,5-epimerase
MVLREKTVPNVVGGDELVAKHSAVNEQGKLRGVPIDSVIFRPVTVPHEDGLVTEVARASRSELADPVLQVHLTTTFPGRVRAWGLHQASSDRLFVASGLVEFTLSERNPGLLMIPPHLYHGWKNIGTWEAIIIINMPTEMYAYEAPDALDLPWDSEAAVRIVPYQW